MADELPAFVGLCPDPAHTHEFCVHVGDPGEHPICPECDQRLVFYRRIDQDEQARRLRVYNELRGVTNDP
jgi:hypothetical protein